MKVLNFGSLNIDYVYSLDHIVQRGETISSESLDIFGGGKGLNQSVALARAGAEVYHAGAIGQDGEFLTELLSEAGVKTEFVRRLDSVRTGNAIIQRDKDGDNCIILYGGANQCIERTQVDEAISFFERGDYIVLQNEINEMAYIMEKAQERGMKIVLNPSPMDEKLLSLPLSFVDLLLLKEVEACQLLEISEKERSDAASRGEELCRLLSDRFPRAMIVLTLGEKGSVCIDRRPESSREDKGRQTAVKQPIYRTRTVDTTAAGDTFTGYFVSGIMRGLSVRDAMDLAARAAAITVSRMGAAPSIPALKQVMERKF